MKIAVVVGTRPEAIKMAPVFIELEKARGGGYDLEPALYVSGQHRDMLDEVLELFDLRPDFDLNVMVPNQKLPDISARMIAGFGQLFQQETPDLVLVHGDTTTAFAAALAAFYQQIPVGHVEAGLRTGVKDNPFPEEMNRRFVDSLATYYFAPTAESFMNLAREGVPGANVLHTGNTVIDALYYVLDHYSADCAERMVKLLPSLPQLLRNKRLLLVTSHRRENLVGTGLVEICHALRTICDRHADAHVIFPVHPNPKVQEVVHGLLSQHPSISLLPPLSYDLFSYMMKQCTLILTDSGGVQEEAPALQKPVVVLRDTSERAEVVKSGGAVLAGTKRQPIVAAVDALLSDGERYARMAHAGSPFGDGQAARRIVEFVSQLAGRRAGEVCEMPLVGLAG